MVKSVVGEETRLQLAEERLLQSADFAQVGLLVGRISRILDRGFVYELLPTPLTDDGRPPCSAAGPNSDRKKPAKGATASKSQPDPGSPLVLDADWVAEHARQVARMLLGGMHVVGIYVWASESSFKASTPLLWQTLRDVARAAPVYSSDPPDERLLAHVSYSPRRWTCKTCTISSTNVSTTMKPCDFKWGKLLGSLQLFRCSYKFDQRLPVSGQPKGETFQHVLEEAISLQSRELQSCTKALIDGKLKVNEDLQCTSGVTHEVELLLPFMNNASSHAKDEEISGVIVFSGIISASAYLGPKETAMEAISELKGDIINSLHSRLDIMCEEVSSSDSSANVSTEAQKETSSGGTDSLDLYWNSALSFPKRVLVPWLGTICICDYLQSSETPEVISSHCREVMSMVSPLDNKSVVQVEEEATSLFPKSFRDATLGRSMAPLDDKDDEVQKTGTRGQLKEGSSSIYLFAVAVLILAILVGWMMTQMLTR